MELLEQLAIGATVISCTFLLILFWAWVAKTMASYEQDQCSFDDNEDAAIGHDDDTID